MVEVFDARPFFLSSLRQRPDQGWQEELHHGRGGEPSVVRDHGRQGRVLLEAGQREETERSQGQRRQPVRLGTPATGHDEDYGHLLPSDVYECMSRTIDPGLKFKWSTNFMKSFSIQLHIAKWMMDTNGLWINGALFSSTVNFVTIQSQIFFSVL
jgi:hypothetical protein